MTIETKYSPGESVFTFQDNKAVELFIDRVEVIGRDGYGSKPVRFEVTYFCSVKYRWFANLHKPKPYKLYQLYSTKEQLILSL